MKRLLHTSIFCLIVCSVFSQDIHYSQFFSAPLQYNPALTGIFNGNIRVAGNYRSQWRAVPVSYLTFAGSVDFKVNPSNSRNGNLNMGIFFNYDKAGDLSLNNTKLGLSTSYLIKLTKNHLISPGVLINYNQRRVDFSNAKTNNQWNGVGYDPSILPELPYDNSNSNIDISGGINYRWQKSYRTHIDIGVGLYNIMSSDQSFAGDEGYNSALDKRLSIYVMTDFKVLNRLNLSGNAVYQKQGPHSALQLNVQGKIFLNKNNDRNVAFILGLGLRTSDAWFPMIGLMYKNLYAGFSYDSNFSQFDIATRSKGGPELSVIYRITKIPNVPNKPCPIY